jgi:hypothetical protein
MSGTDLIKPPPGVQAIQGADQEAGHPEELGRQILIFVILS